MVSLGVTKPFKGPRPAVSLIEITCENNKDIIYVYRYIVKDKQNKSNKFVLTYSERKCFVSSFQALRINSILTFCSTFKRVNNYLLLSLMSIIILLFYFDLYNVLPNSY